MEQHVPVVDLGAGPEAAAALIDRACREHGFFCIVGHGVPDELARRLDRSAREFFALDEQRKAEIAMERAGKAWRGWFPVGAELTSGRPDHKEGLYVGEDHPPDHPRVRAGVPLHGTNLFPAEPADLGPTVREWLTAMTGLGRLVMRAVALGLGLPAAYFDDTLLAEPTVLFRIFHYPPGENSTWGVGEHTDYGLLTILLQDDCGGLQVRSPSGWIDVPPLPGAFVCNIGDMLERITAGRYRSTPHRVRNVSGRSRFSFPFFLDPGWDAWVAPLPLAPEPASAGAPARWDGADLHAWQGRYGDYLLAKVAKVFPDLHARVR